MNYNNLAQLSNYIAGADKFKNIPFFLASVNLPGIILNHPEVGGRHSTRMKLSGDSVQFNALSFDMLIDEDFTIYKDFMKEIKKNINVDNGTFNDISFNFFIEISNSKGNKVMKVEFFNCRIESIGDILLDTQSEETVSTLSVEVLYDYFNIENTKQIHLLDKIVQNPIPTESVEFVENFQIISDDYQLWGYPTPNIVPDNSASNKFALNTNGTNFNEAGIVLNSLPLNYNKKCEFIFRAKQLPGEDYYMTFGLTEGIGVDSEVNGRTGQSIIEITVNSDNSTTLNYTDDNDYHEYKIEYNPGSESIVYVDNIEVNRYLTNPSHEEFYLFYQGKAPNRLDYIRGTYFV